MSDALSVEVCFDFICPWCWIGKRQLQLALMEFSRLQPQRRVVLAWRSQQLLPHVPPQGLPFDEFYLDRLGSASAVAARKAVVREAGARVGLAFDLSNIPLMPNTRAAHALLADAQEQCDEDTVDTLVEGVFEAHFMRGMNLDDVEFLDALADCHGIRRTKARLVFETMAPGVPLFIVNRAEILSGAQPPQRLLELLTRA